MISARTMTIATNTGDKKLCRTVSPPQEEPPAYLVQQGTQEAAEFLPSSKSQNPTGHVPGISQEDFDVFDKLLLSDDWCLLTNQQNLVANTTTPTQKSLESPPFEEKLKIATGTPRRPSGTSLTEKYLVEEEGKTSTATGTSTKNGNNSKRSRDIYDASGTTNKINSAPQPLYEGEEQKRQKTQQQTRPYRSNTPPHLEDYHDDSSSVDHSTSSSPTNVNDDRILHHEKFMDPWKAFMQRRDDTDGDESCVKSSSFFWTHNQDSASFSKKTTVAATNRQVPSKYYHPQMRDVLTTSSYQDSQHVHFLSTGIEKGKARNELDENFGIWPLPNTQHHHFQPHGRQNVSRDEKIYLSPPRDNSFEQIYPPVPPLHKATFLNSSDLYTMFSGSRIKGSTTGRDRKNLSTVFSSPKNKCFSAHYPSYHHQTREHFSHLQASLSPSMETPRLVSTNTGNVPIPSFVNTAPTSNIMQPYDRREILALSAEQDENWLSEFLSFVRSDCIEVFTADEKDVMSRMNSKKVLLGQVGIRCRFCAHRCHRERAGRSSSFPSSLSRIYQSLTMMLRDHFINCDHMPHDVKQRFILLKANTSQGATDSKKYWVESARGLGLVDTEKGIRFAK